MALTLNPYEYYAFLRRDFSSFIERAFCHPQPDHALPSILGTWICSRRSRGLPPRLDHTTRFCVCRPGR